VEIKASETCQVLVIGAGLAGITAALEAAKTVKVLLLCEGKLFSGSSFYPGTWGLGLIGPENEEDQADLAQTIHRVGCGMADPELVNTFVTGIAPAIRQVREMGIKLRRAGQKEQREFIPCFDHKHRDWNGLEFDSARTVYGARLKELGVQVVEHCRVLHLVKREGRVCGAVAAVQGQVCYFSCGSLVLATGGYGSLFRYHLCTEDVCGMGQALALEAGCKLVSMEFMQMMLGYLEPAPKTIYNEKAYRFTQFFRPDGTPLFCGAQGQALLEMRSGHGPFTARLPSRQVDVEIFRSFLADQRGVTAEYRPELRDDPPEFLRTYFTWLEQEKGVDWTQPIRLGVFAHAANGGVQIDARGFTGVPGLYACGEVTGGMHGADRLGGLSTANGLVFGGIAGAAAAADCGEKRSPDEIQWDGWAVEQVPEITARLQQLMFRHAMVLREEKGLTDALQEVHGLRAGLERTPTRQGDPAAQARRLECRLLTAESILTAQLARRESRGSHYRTDYPAQSERFDCPVTVEGTETLELKEKRR
jgi:L-aspartate oxidase